MLAIIWTGVGCSQNSIPAPANPATKSAFSIPTAFPVYPLAHLTSQKVSGRQLEIIWTSGASTDQVSLYYQQNLSVGDWEYFSTGGSPGFDSLQDPYLHGTLLIGPQDSQTEILVLFIFSPHSPSESGIPTDFPVYPQATFARGSNDGSQAFVLWQVSIDKFQVNNYYIMALGSAPYIVGNRGLKGASISTQFTRRVGNKTQQGLLLVSDDPLHQGSTLIGVYLSD